MKEKLEVSRHKKINELERNKNKYEGCEKMNIIDIGLILILFMFGIVGWKRGLIKESVSLVGIIIIFVIAFTLKEPVGNFLCKYFPFFHFGGNLKGIISINILIYQLFAFFIIYSLLFSIYAIILKLSGIIQKLINMTLILLLPSKIGGFLVAFVKGYIITFIILLVIMIPLKESPVFRESSLATKIVYNTPILSSSANSITKTVTEVYKLGEQLSKNELTANEANLQTIDIMLKYKIVSPKTVEQLIVLDKLKNINGIDNIIKKYQ